MQDQEKAMIAKLKARPEDIQLLVETGRSLISNNRASAFLELFETIYPDESLKGMPPQLVFSIGQTALAEKKFSLASKLLGHLQKKDNRSPALIIPLSEALINAGDLVEAKNVLESAIRQGGNNDPSLLTNLAIVEAEAGNYSQAESLYKRVVNIRPKDFLGHYNLGGFYTMIGRNNDAIQSYECCLSIVPNAPEAQNAIDGLKQNGMQSTADQDSENSILTRLYNMIEEEKWEDAIHELESSNNQIDCIRRHAAILELPRRFQNSISDENLYDPKQQVKTIQLFEENDPFLKELAVQIRNEKSLIWNRAGKPTRDGAQSHELLAAKGKSPAINHLIDRLTDIVLSCKSKAAESITGPWADPIRLSGWAVLLKHGGHQKRHIHPEAKLSGVFYIQVPEISEGTKENKGDLVFLGSNGRSLLQVTPKQGGAIVFPSYLPHQTIPLENTMERICIAFNVQ